MSAEQRDPAAGNDCVETEGRGEMIKAPIDLQDLRRRLYVKAKAEPSWRFWGIYVHVCKLETLRKAYALARANNGAPGAQRSADLVSTASAALRDLSHPF